MKFLDSVGDGSNITLFHYRNHGADYGRVLAGIDVPPDDRERFDAAIEGLGYPCVDETDNPAYRMFLDTGADNGDGPGLIPPWARTKFREMQNIRIVLRNHR